MHDLAILPCQLHLYKVRSKDVIRWVVPDASGTTLRAASSVIFGAINLTLCNYFEIKLFPTFLISHLPKAVTFMFILCNGMMIETKKKTKMTVITLTFTS